jgi:hypothetical protein
MCELAGVLAVAAVCGLPALSAASVQFVAQSNVATISFLQPDFSDARMDGANTFHSTANFPGDVRRVTWSPQTGFNQRVETSGGVVVDGITDTSGYSYDVHHPTGEPGSHTYFWSRLQPYGQAFYASVESGVPQLHISVTSTPIVDAGGSFTWQATMPGDWSSLGAGPGQAELVSLNAGWIVTQRFVFDGNLTRIAFERQPCVLTGPGAVMNFYGVPAPGGVITLGVMGVASCRRRRSSAS